MEKARPEHGGETCWLEGRTPSSKGGLQAILVDLARGCVRPEDSYSARIPSSH